MSSTPETEQETTTTAPVLLQQPQDPVNVYDFGSVKAKIDKGVRDILMIERSYKEDLTTSNIRILLGIVACASAITAYFKSNPTVVLSLCAAYIIFGFFAQYLGFYLERNTIFLSQPSSLTAGIIRAESEVDFDKKSNCPSYTIKLVTVKSRLGLFARYRFTDPSCTGSHTWHLNDLFDEQGTLDYAKLLKDVSRALEVAERKKH